MPTSDEIAAVAKGPRRPGPPTVCPITVHPSVAFKHPPRPKVGPGTELAKGLKELGIFGAKGCGCEAKAAIMDRLGADWCEKNVPKIVGWLRKSVEKQGIPDVTDDMLAAAVRWAVEQARTKPPASPESPASRRPAPSEQ